MRDFIFIDKPKGMTSHDVLDRLKEKFNSFHPNLEIPKMGHAGTLDPLASGLLIVGLGKGTKKLGKFSKLEKRYTVDIKLGESRTTGDMEGDIIEEMEVPKLEKETIKHVLWAMQGTVRLPVPKYSAVKVKGKKLYESARRGEDVEVPMRDMRIYQAKLLFLRPDLGNGVITVRLEVASGVYVRSIVEEIGKRLGYPAVTMSLRRTRIGPYLVREARTLDRVHADSFF